MNCLAEPAEVCSEPFPFVSMAAMANLSQVRSNILPQIFLTCCSLYERIETQNLGKSLAALAAMAALVSVVSMPQFGKFSE